MLARRMLSRLRAGAFSKVLRSAVPKRRAYDWSKTLPTDETITVTVNGTPVQVRKGSLILDACKAAHAYVPTLCYHPMLRIVGQCRMCLVEVGGKLLPACATSAKHGMEIQTETEQTQKSARTNLQLLRCRHPNDCATCEANGNCTFQHLAYRYGAHEILPGKYTGAIYKPRNIDGTSPALIREMDKCIMCTRCVRACSDIQGMNIFGIVGRGGEDRWTPSAEGYERPPATTNQSPHEVARVTTVYDLPINQTACISCGQCTSVCPVGALIERPHIHMVQHGLAHKGDKVWVAAPAPAVRVALSEEFSMEAGSVVTGKLVSALRALGFDYVFDVNFGADLTIVEEATEFVRRLRNGGPFPMFTSCCPGWINLVEKTYPQLISQLSTCKSPQGMMGALIKHYFAKKLLGRDPDDVVFVSIMPCVAKKDEIARPQLSYDSEKRPGTKKPETDYVLTTRELAHLIHEERIPFVSLPEGEFDKPLGMTTGAAALFGSTGGVLEAALRTAAEFATGQPLPSNKIDFTAVRGFSSMREATVQVGDSQLRVAVCHGTKQVRQAVEQALRGESPYHLIEVMACPGGCVGGGGEPKTSAIEPQVLQKRISAIYKIDSGKPVRKSHENPAIKELYKSFLGEPASEIAHHLLHTHYTDRSGDVKGRWEKPFGAPPSVKLDEPHPLAEN